MFQSQQNNGYSPINLPPTATPTFGDDEWGQDHGQGQGSALLFPTTVLVARTDGEIRPPTFTQLSPPTFSWSRSAKCVILLVITVFLGLGLGVTLMSYLTGRGQTGGNDNYFDDDDLTFPITSNDRASICTTPECKEAVARMRSSIDESFDPCHDFYQYACGGWIRDQSAKLREDKGSNSTSITELGAMDKVNVKRITKLIDGLPLPDPYMPPKTVNMKIKRFYNSCINQRNLMQILDILTKSDNSTSPKSLITEAIPGGIGQEEMKEWEEILKMLHPDPGSLPEYLKFALESEEDDTEAKSTICTHFARELLPEGVAKLFVTAHYMNDYRTDSKINSLIEKLWLTFRIQTITSSPWLKDEVSRRNISLSISGMSVVSGYLADILNSSHVEGLYSNVTISSNFLLNLKELVTAREDRKKEGGVIGEFHLEFYKDTTKATAFYMQLLDTIFIPAGIVQIPTFHHSFPDVLKFGNLGTTVAHEFAHSLHPYIEGITLESELLDTPLVLSESVVTSWSRQEYEKRSQCVVGQYDRDQIPLPSNDTIFTPLLRVNGTLTVKENIADIIGMQIAFKSFMENAGASFQPIPGLSEKFSKEQIFFIASAQGRCHAFLDDETEVKLLREQVATDVHSPSSVRVLGSLRNYDEFSKAFKCPLGSRYNPEKKCTFFNS